VSLEMPIISRSTLVRQGETAGRGFVLTFAERR
jgi:hypothetical protein